MEEFDTSYLAWILYKLFYGIDKEIAKKKERSYVEIDFGNKIINMSGDTDYNFGPGWSHYIRKKYETIRKKCHQNMRIFIIHN